jgi:hypothetical protein
MCCGRRRSAWSAASAPLRAPRSVAPATSDASVGRRVAPTQGMSAQAPAHAVMLEYLEAAPIRVWGPATGRPYDFSSAEPRHAMDARDAAALARSGPFRRTATGGSRP